MTINQSINQSIKTANNNDQHQLQWIPWSSTTFLCIKAWCMCDGVRIKALCIKAWCMCDGVRIKALCIKAWCMCDGVRTRLFRKLNSDHWFGVGFALPGRAQLQCASPSTGVLARQPGRVGHSARGAPWWWRTHSGGQLLGTGLTAHHGAFLPGVPLLFIN